MITSEILENAKSIGGNECWKMLKENMSKGQEFYTTDLGKVSFLGFVSREDGKEVAIFRTRSGMTSYDYFYRELLCKGDVFLSKEDMDQKIFDRNYWKMVDKAKYNSKLLHKMLTMLTDVISVEVTVKSDLGQVTQICNLEDVFESDNVGCVISITTI
tara:strand:- start:11736 stop:12209 length:474 start_codon:yes stop_codon:yes gene_type:complete